MILTRTARGVVKFAKPQHIVRTYALGDEQFATWKLLEGHEASSVVLYVAMQVCGPAQDPLTFCSLHEIESGVDRKKMPNA